MLAHHHWKEVIQKVPIPPADFVGVESVDWYEYIHFRCATTARGFIRFVNLRPDMKSPQVYICDTCGDRVTKAKQAKHAWNHR